MTELEIKRKTLIETTEECQFCSDRALKILEIGEFGYAKGNEYVLCNDPVCEETAIEKEMDIVDDKDDYQADELYAIKRNK